MPTTTPAATTQQRAPNYGSFPIHSEREVENSNHRKYHLLSRNISIGPSKVIAEFCVALLGVLAFVFFVRLALGAAVALEYSQLSGAQAISFRQRLLIFSTASGICGLLYVWLIVRLFGVRPLGFVSSVEGRIRMSWLALCVPIALGTTLLGDALAFLLGQLDGSTKRPFYYWLEGLSSASLPMTLLIVVLATSSVVIWPYLWGLSLQTAGSLSVNPAAGYALVAFIAILVDAASGASFSAFSSLVSILFACAAVWISLTSGGLEAALALYVALRFMDTLRHIGAAQLHLEVLYTDGLYAVGQLCGVALFVLTVAALAKIMQIRVTS